MMFVRLIEMLLCDPPKLDFLKYVWDHLLLPDLNKVGVVRGASTQLDSASLIEGL